METLPSSTAPTALTEAEGLKLFEGIVLGRTLHQLEKALGIKAERLLSLVRGNEQAFLDFKEARSYSAYVIEDDISEKLRLNADNPESAVKNNALKVWADHMHWVAERRNPEVYSGKATLSLNTPIQINTTLDLGQTKAIDGVYRLEATTTQEVSAADIDPAAFDIVAIESSNPFTGAANTQFDPQNPEGGAQKGPKREKARPIPAGRPRGVVESSPGGTRRVKSKAAGKVSGAQSRAPGDGKRENATKRGRKAAEEA